MKYTFTLSWLIKKGLLILSVLFTFNLYAADYYWVGGAGHWSDLNHWRLGSSAGSNPCIVPAASDNVFFTSDSGFGTTPATATGVARKYHLFSCDRLKGWLLPFRAPAH